MYFQCLLQTTDNLIASVLITSKGRQTFLGSRCVCLYDGTAKRNSESGCSAPKSTLCLQRTLKTDFRPDRRGLVTDRKPRFTQSRLHTLSTDSHTQNHTLLSPLSLTCVFSLNTLLEIKQENESVTLLFAKGQLVHEDKNR